jgi:hypothetical protein
MRCTDKVGYSTLARQVVEKDRCVRQDLLAELRQCLERAATGAAGAGGTPFESRYENDRTGVDGPEPNGARLASAAAVLEQRRPSASRMARTDVRDHATGH